MKLNDIKNMSLDELVKKRVINIYAEPSVNFPDELSYDDNGEPNCKLGSILIPICLTSAIKTPLIVVNHIYDMSQTPDTTNINTKKNKKTGFLYIMKNTRNGFFKIGFTSKSPEYREQTLQSEEPEIKLIFSSKKTKTISDERGIHIMYDKNRVRGEWFDLSENEIKNIIALMEK